MGRRLSVAALLVAPSTVLLAPPSRAEEVPLFVDATSEVGIDFVHDNGMTGARFFAEIMGPGAALFDWDGDGDLDMYLVQGGRFDAVNSAGWGDRLLRSDLVENGSLRMVDVTDTSGLEAYGYGMPFHASLTVDRSRTLIASLRINLELFIIV